MIIRGYKTNFESKTDFLKKFDTITDCESTKKLNKSWNILPHAIPNILYSNSVVAGLLRILNGQCKHMLECVRSIRTNFDFLVGNSNIDD